jgi:hypothetical protein
VLRQPDVELAVLNRARWLLRRGLSVERASVAVVTTSPTTIWASSVQDLDTLADVKLLVARAVRPGGGGAQRG